jgi:hypothetical protein
MKTSLCRAWVLSAAFVVTAALARAHPGHDGHDLTWDFSHLAQHPFATIGCAAVVGAGVCVIMQLMRRPSMPRGQSFRGSHPNRGK